MRAAEYALLLSAAAGAVLWAASLALSLIGLPALNGLIGALR